MEFYLSVHFPRGKVPSFHGIPKGVCDPRKVNITDFKESIPGFPGGAVVKNPPANTGNTG